MPPFISIIASLGALFLMTACQNPPPEKEWQKVLITETSLHEVEKGFQKFGIHYDLGTVSYRVMILDDLNAAQRKHIFENPETLALSHIGEAFHIYLNGTPTDLVLAAFPESGHQLTGKIIGEPVPEWILKLKVDLPDAYIEAQKGDPEAIHQFANALLEMEDPFVPWLGPLYFYWTKKAADAGHVPSIYETAINYQGGYGVVADEKASEIYMEKAIKAEFPMALNNRAFNTATRRTASHKELEQARLHVQRALEFEADEPAYLDTLALVEARLGNWTDAVHIQKAVIEIFRDRYSVEGIISFPADAQEEYLYFQQMMKAYENRVIPEALFL